MDCFSRRTTPQHKGSLSPGWSLAIQELIHVGREGGVELE